MATLVIGNVDVEGEHPGRTRRVRLLSPTTQGNRWNKGISLEQAIRLMAGLEG